MGLGSGAGAMQRDAIWALLIPQQEDAAACSGHEGKA